MTVDEYVTALHNIARECQLDTMYDDFMLQALLLGINDDHLRRKLFTNAGGDTGLGLEQAIKKCRIAVNSKQDMAAIQTEESVKVISRKQKSVKKTSFRTDDDTKRSTQVNKRSKGKCGTVASHTHLVSVQHMERNVMYATNIITSKHSVAPRNM